MKKLSKKIKQQTYALAQEIYDDLYTQPGFSMYTGDEARDAIQTTIKRFIKKSK